MDAIKRIDQPFPTTVGIEYALVPKGRKPTDDLEERLCQIGIETNNKFCLDPNFNKYIYGNSGKSELGAYEYSSTPCSNYREVRAFYNYANKLFKFGEKIEKVKFVANTTCKGTYIEGGGGHLHLGVVLPDKSDGWNLSFRRNLAIYMLNNPVIQWFMADWCDDCTMTSTFYNAFNKTMRCKVTRFTSGLLDPFLEAYSGGWGRGPTQIRTGRGIYKNGSLPTIEFRCFAAPTNFQHLKDNIDLALAIWQRAHNNIMEGYLNNLNFESVAMIERYTKDHNLITEFQFLIDSLKLDYKRYKKYEKNFRMRQKYGRLFSYKFAGLD